MSDQPCPPVVSVKVGSSSRRQSFLLPFPGGVPPAGTPVIVRTELGPMMGTVAPTVPAAASRRVPPPTPAHVFMRLATKDDLLARAKHEQRELEALRVALLKIRERALGMKLARVEQLFDGSRLIFYFTAEGRIDFRELVRDLASVFRCRIEMRQIGVRDEARLLGGYGSCGRPLCCATWVQNFEPVSIKMAKQQELSLNPTKLSGLCGRLKCCLRHELPEGRAVTRGGSGDDEGGCGGGCRRGCGSE